VLKMMLCNATTAAALLCIKFPRLHLLQPIIQDLRERPAVVEMRDVIHRPVQRIVHVAKIKLGVCWKMFRCKARAVSDTCLQAILRNDAYLYVRCSDEG